MPPIAFGFGAAAPTSRTSKVTSTLPAGSKPSVALTGWPLTSGELQIEEHDVVAGSRERHRAG